MNKRMKQDSEKKLPKFEARTLGADELGRVTGGFPPESAGCVSVCHADGIYDGDGAPVS
ncbi:hypothetical protein SAMN02745121_05297 [Nannocystis exedens]|uniref:Uncharacterized protein n=1 Tax=Nannocystis exedens TaxID=54 RepID=A0A1I2CXU2_9BACT|nr:hypothetical protein [Nannocystis exedens]PCC68623.1 hypothetical protein NAEX_01639 [Nannocystis exedens]SFE72560.1 hypothetical protein SAMN02745121_05297 [Nannocystis exedens]